MKIVYVGFTSEAVSNVDELMALPKAPSNYKDLDKIKAYIEAALIKQREEAKDNPLTGKLKTAYYITGGKLYEKDVPFLRLCEFDVIAGHRISTFMELASLDWIEKTGFLPDNLHWTRAGKMDRFPHLGSKLLLEGMTPKRIFDPIDALGGQDAVENPRLLIKRWKLNITQLETAEDYARLAQAAGEKFFKAR